MVANNTTDLRSGVNGELGVKAPCRVASIVNIILEGLQTINGVAVKENDIILVTGQTNKTENGIYIASTSAWQRAVWFDDELDAVPGTLVESYAGTSRSKTLWLTRCINNPIQFGTSEIEFEFFAQSGFGSLQASNNLGDLSNFSTARDNLGVKIGADVQAYNANLQAIAGLTSTSDTIPFFTGAGTASLKTIGVATGNIPVVGTASATESLAGLAEIATQAEVNAGTDDLRFVTPLKLKNTTLSGGGLIRTTIFTTSGTWTKQTGVNSVLVKVQGGGGAGTAGVANNAGGGAGGYCEKFITSGLGATETVIVGTGGILSGITTGGSSSFGSHCQANGGLLNSGAVGGLGGVASGGDINIRGRKANYNTNNSNPGADSILGYGEPSGAAVSGSGAVYGGGGAGGNAGGTPSGNGASGIVIVYEFN